MNKSSAPSWISAVVTVAVTHLFFPSSALAQSSADWSQWRGPNRDGFVPDGTTWPDSISATQLEEVWKVELEEGYSGPLVVGDSVYTVETADKKNEIVRSFNRANGEQRWETSWAGSMKVPFFAAKNGSWVRSTPAIADGKIFVAGMRDVMVCLDIATGEEQWRVDFAEREGTKPPSFGFVCSPLIDGSDLYVQAGSAVTKVNIDDGSTVWRSMEDRREMYGSAFSSPVLAKIAGKDQLLAQTRAEIAGLDPSSGDVLWKYPVKAFRGMNILTPVPVGDRIFTATYGGGAFAFEIAGEDGEFDCEKVWQMKVEGYMSTPTRIGDCVYMHGRDKRFHGFDVVTGDLLWSTKEKFGEYWSLVANGDRILALDEDGELLYWRVSPEKAELLGRAKLPSKSPTWAHLAVCGDEIYVRDLKGLTRFRWKTAE